MLHNHCVSNNMIAGALIPAGCLLAQSWSPTPAPSLVLCLYWRRDQETLDRDGAGRQISWQISWGGQELVVCPGPILAQHKGTLLRHFHNTGGLEVNTVVWHSDLNSEKGFVLESLVLAHVRSSLSASASFWCSPGRLNLPSDADWNETPITGLTRNKMNFLKGSFPSKQTDQQDMLWNNSTHKT